VVRVQTCEPSTKIKGRNTKTLAEYLLAYCLTAHGDFVRNDCKPCESQTPTQSITQTVEHGPHTPTLMGLAESGRLN
jgi:hypothetical protein